MERPYIDELLEALGARYKLGDRTDDGVELKYRFGKAQFRASRVTVLDPEGTPSLELLVDVRVPEGHEVGETDELVAALEEKSLTPRRFERQSDETNAMTTEGGKAAGHARTLRYRADAGEAKDACERIRAIVETLDIPVVVGIHEAGDLVAKKPLPPPKKKGSSMPHDPMEVWTYTLAGGVVRSLSVVVDPNVRTLEVFERKLLSKTQIGETLKLAHVSKFGIRRSDSKVELVVEKRDGERVSIAESVPHPEFVATAERLAKKTFIPIEEM